MATKIVLLPAPLWPVIAATSMSASERSRLAWLRKLVPCRRSRRIRLLPPEAVERRLHHLRHPDNLRRRVILVTREAVEDDESFAQRLHGPRVALFKHADCRLRVAPEAHDSALLARPVR